MVDHTFLFTGAVRTIKRLLDAQELGHLYYYDTMRVNLGLFQHDVNVVWDLAPHDLAIIDYLLEAPPEALIATGQKHVNAVEDVAFLTVFYPGRLIAHVNVNWLSPVKVRSTLLGGDKKMLIWNDLESDEKSSSLRSRSRSENPGRCLRFAGRLPVRRYVARMSTVPKRWAWRLPISPAASWRTNR